MTEPSSQNFTNSSRRPRILVLASTFPRFEGDHEPAFVFELNKRLSEHFDIFVLAPHTQGSAEEESFGNQHVIRFRYAPLGLENLAYEGGIQARLRQQPLRYLLVPFFLFCQYIAAIKLMRRYQFDLIHAHWLIPQGLVAALIKATYPGAPQLLCTSHGADLFSLQGSLLTKLKKWIIKRCDCITVVSQAMKEKALMLSAAPSKLDIAPMGVDLASVFVPNEERRKQNTLVFVGRLVEKKGLIYLIDALPAILEHHPNTRLRIAGSGPEEPHLRERAKSLGISDSIDFIGPVENKDLPQLYQSSTIAIFPFIVSKSGDQEGLGLVMIEALGCGCIVVASSLPAIKDIIVNNKTGLTVTPGDSKAISDKIIQVLHKPDEYSQLSNSGRKWVIDRFDWNVTANKYLTLIDSMLCKNQ